MESFSPTSTTAHPFTAEPTGSSKKQAPSVRPSSKAMSPTARLHEKYGSFLDSITFMPVIETDYGGNLQ